MIHIEKKFSPEYLQNIQLTSKAVEILRRLRNSEPKLNTLKLHPLDQNTYTLFSLLQLAPVAVAGTLWPYTVHEHKSTLTGEDMLFAFATHHAEAVANDSDMPSPFTLGIHIPNEERGLFNWIHTLTAVQKTRNNIFISYDGYRITHTNLTNADCSMKESDFFAVHCGSVITPISQSTAIEITRRQQTYSHLFGNLPSDINYQAIFGGVFATKNIST
jgi:hypothetical protein